MAQRMLQNKIVNSIFTNNFVRNSLILFISSTIANFLGYLFHLVIGRMVEVETYGEVESLTAIIGIISIPTAVLTTIATKYSACSKAENNPASTLSLFKYLNKKVISYGIPLFIIALLLTPLFKNFLKIENDLAIITIWVIMLLSFFSSITSGILIGWQKFYTVGLASVLGGIIKLASAIILIWLGFNSSGIMGSFVFGIFISYLVAIFYLRFILKSKSDNLEIWKKITDLIPIKKYIHPVLFGSLAIAILGNVDMVLAKHNLGSFETGQYGALTIVSKIIFFATSSIVTVLFSMSAEREHKKGNSLKIFYYAISLVVIACLAATIIYFAFPNFILGLLFREKYTDVSGYLGWFAILASIYSVANLVLTYLLSVLSPNSLKSAHSYLAISIIATFAVLFVGKNVSAILWIMIPAQFLAAFTGFYYLLKNRKNNEKVDFNYSPNL